MELETFTGDSFQSVTLKAKEVLNASDNVFVQFNFNGVKCVVTSETNPEWLYRDYQNSLSYKLPEIATGTEPEYSDEIQAKLEIAKLEREKRQKAAEKKYKAEETKKLKAFNKKVEGIEIELFNRIAWKMWAEKNQDGYGQGILKYAENWAKLMQVELASGKIIERHCPTS